MRERSLPPRSPAPLLAVAALLLACNGCKAQPEPNTSVHTPTQPASPTTQANTQALELSEPEAELPLLPVLGREALEARAKAQRALLGRKLFEDARGEAVPWLSPQGSTPETIGATVEEDLLASLPGSSGLGGPAQRMPHTGRRINGNALGLFEPLEIDEAGPQPLKHFYAALRTLKAGNDSDGKVRVLMYGASHTDADIYPHYLRTYLRERFGDGGHGFVHIAKPWRWYGHVEMNVEGLAKWKTEHAQRTGGRSDGYWGLMGTSLASRSKKAWGRVSHRDGSKASNYEIYFLKQPRGGSFKVLVDGKRVATVRTRAKDFGAGYHSFKLEEAAHQIEVRLVGNGEVRLFGLTAEREQDGIVVDTLGIGGTRASNLLQWDEQVWGDNLKRRDPDLVVLAYGTNEANDGRSIQRYREDLRLVLTRMKTITPEASCLLIGPGDFPTKLADGQFAARPRVLQIISAQSQIALEMGCAFWDAQAFMGGELSMVDWAAAQPRMAKADHIHLTRRGYVRMGMALVDAMMQGFDSDDPVGAAVGRLESVETVLPK